MPFIVRVYCENNIYSIDLSSVEHATIGNDQSDTLQLENYGLKKHQISIEKNGEHFIIKGKRLYNSENSPVSSETITVGQRYSIDANSEIYIAIHPKQADSNKAIGLESAKEVYIGRSRDNNIVLHNKRTSSEHCKIYRENGLFKIRDLRSTNGTYVNGKKIYEKTLVDGDRINISVYEIVLTNNALTFYNVGDDLELNMTAPDKVAKRGTISMFDVNINVQHESEGYDIQIKQQIKTGTKSVFDI